MAVTTVHSKVKQYCYFFLDIVADAPTIIIHTFFRFSEGDIVIASVRPYVCPYVHPSVRYDIFF